MAEEKTGDEPDKPGALQALAILVAVVPVVWFYTWLESALGLTASMFAGFLFILYWTSIRNIAPNEFFPSLLGTLGGLGLGYLLFTLPTVYGAAGIAVIGFLIALSVYLLIRGQAAIIVNPALMLMLTVCGSGVFKSPIDFATAAASVLVAALYSGGLLLLAGQATRLMARRE